MEKMRYQQQSFFTAVMLHFISKPVLITILIPVNKNLELNLLINFEIWNQNDLLNSTA